jgi:membrane-associated phospholipid phosphatase
MGSASLVLPVLAITAVSLWRAGQLNAVRVWLIAMTLAVSFTLATKIMFLGWGIGIASLDFTGISGHTLLVTSVLPVLLGWYLAQDQGSSSLAGVMVGLLVGVIVGISRVALGAHSVSEVVAAWFMGAAISTLALNAMNGRLRCPWFAKLAPLIFLLAFHTPSSTYLPTHDWEVELALALSGHERPYTRRHLIARADLKVQELPDQSEDMSGEDMSGASKLGQAIPKQNPA